jgi:carotenoid 1,2-hydratase
MPRRMPSGGDPHQLVRTLEDTPFYARSLIEATIDGEHGRGLHESLDMRRFTQPWVQTLLPFRMPRFA